MKIDNVKFGEIMFKSGIFLLLLVFFMFLFFLVTPYIHEIGHVVFGFGDGVLKGNFNEFTISVWKNHPFLNFLKIPQQTKIISGNGSLNFALGGPIFSILIFLALSLLGYKRSGDKKWFLLFIAVLLFEISGNIICGTDNFIQNPLSICNKTLDLSIQYFSVALFSGIFSYFSMKKLNFIEKAKYRGF